MCLARCERAKGTDSEHDRNQATACEKPHRGSAAPRLISEGQLPRGIETTEASASQVRSGVCSLHRFRVHAESTNATTIREGSQGLSIRWLERSRDLLETAGVGRSLRIARPPFPVAGVLWAQPLLPLARVLLGSGASTHGAEPRSGWMTAVTERGHVVPLNLFSNQSRGSFSSCWRFCAG
jgi:hypothetical protein